MSGRLASAELMLLCGWAILATVVVAHINHKDEPRPEPPTARTSLAASDCDPNVMRAALDAIGVGFDPNQTTPDCWIDITVAGEDGERHYVAWTPQKGFRDEQ